MNAAAAQARPQPTAGAIFRRILANAGKLLGGRAVNAVLSLAYTAVAARALGVKGLGVLVMIHAFAQLLGDVVKFQSWQTVLQYGAEPLAQRRLDELHRVVRFTLMLDLISGLVGMGVGVGGALAFGGRLGWGADQAPLAAAYVLSVMFITAAAPLGILRLLDRFDVLAAQAAVISVVRLIGCAVGFVLHADLAFFLLVWALGTVAGFLLLAAAAWREMDRQGLLHGFRWLGPTRISTPGAWRFAWATNLNATLGTAFTHLVTLMVGGLLGPADAALWRIGRQVADAIAKPVRLLIPALYPELVRLRAERREKTMWRLTARIALAAGAVGLLLLIVSGFAGAPLLRLVMGAGFAAAAGVMTWQVAAAVVNLVSLPLEPMVISLGQAGATVRVRVVVAAAYAAALPFLVRRFGVEAAGAALVASSLAIALGMLWLLLRQRSQADRYNAA
ncbi:MAG TPA: lipopolysaccharide biosynthesis protein [Phenylobacterium sp.]|uniref:lipopolysaccharide biosynthesis protein n=1 Tax=Phenylobacterium sp. TaxID=1871053 RepID=UPI002B4877D0|nr:lipopolysaccharide biosynthesis protein [Phenylobacterium sp.]HKR89701.1 lipopolysaccharide biosynthesis protein [Phenylobacterium sp.]